MNLSALVLVTALSVPADWTQNDCVMFAQNLIQTYQLQARGLPRPVIEEIWNGVIEESNLPAPSEKYVRENLKRSLDDPQQIREIFEECRTHAKKVPEGPGI